MVSVNTSALRTVATVNRFHLGDNLVHLGWLRRMAQRYPDVRFVHSCEARHLWQLSDVVCDLPNIGLTALGNATPDALDSWRGSGGWWYRQNDRNSFASHSVRWFDIMAEQMGLENPVKDAGEMIFDYPALERKRFSVGTPEFLVIDSPPFSGQFARFDALSIRQLSRDLSHVGPVFTTSAAREFGMSVTDIGHIARTCKYVIGVSTGPSWTTFNKWAVEYGTKWLLMLDNEMVNIAPRTTCVDSVDAARLVLKAEGIL